MRRPPLIRRLPAALILLTLEGIEHPGLAFGYMLLFGLGSIAGMAALSCVVALPLICFLVRRNPPETSR